MTAITMFGKHTWRYYVILYDASKKYNNVKEFSKQKIKDKQTFDHLTVILLT